MDRESSHVSGDFPLTPMSESFTNRDSLAPSSMGDSILTGSSDVDSSVVTSVISEKSDNYINEEKRQSHRSLVQGTTSPFYHRKRFWALCIAISVTLSAIFIPLLFLVIIPSVAQSSINHSFMNFGYVNITQPTNDSFIVSMSGETTKTGPFSATITFNGPVDVLYDDVVIGSFEMQPLKVSGGKGIITGKDQVFTIKDKQQFLEFSSKVMVVESFKWTIQGSANVHALGINTNNLKLHKDLLIPGSNGFSTNSLDELSVVQNPDKTLSMKAKAELTNPSPVGIELGSMVMQLGYNQTIIATVTLNNVFIVAGKNVLNIEGTAETPVTDADKSNYEKVMNAYLTNKPIEATAKILSVLPKSGVPVDWLNAAVKDLTLKSVIGNQPTPPQFVKKVNLGSTKLKFTADAPYSPTLSASNTVADYDLPFKVDLNVKSIEQKLTMIYKGKPVATIEIPESPVINTPTQLSVNISETRMNAVDSSKDLFSDLFKTLTTAKASDIIVSGEADVKAFTSLLGDVEVQGLAFNVSTALEGFDQFGSSSGSPPGVSNINILEGTPKQLIMSATVGLVNPSPHSISAGKVTLNVFYKGQKIGTSIIADLSLSPGTNPLTVFTILDDPMSNSGKDLLFSFLTGQPATINIKGFEGSTDIVSLLPAFEAIDVSSTLPSSSQLGQQFFGDSKISFDGQTAATNVSIATTSIINGYDAPISIYTIKSTFSIAGTQIGSLDQDLRNNPIFIPGKTAKTIQLPVGMNLDPNLAFRIMRGLAVQNGLDVSVLDSLIALGNFDVPGANLNAQPTPEAIKSFDLGKFVTTALAKIPSTINATSEVAVGEYFMPMTYQQDIVATTDQSVLQMIPAYSAPIISKLVGQVQLDIDSVFLENIDVGSFDLLISAQIPNTGPIAATITFPEGISIGSNNVGLGILYSQPISSVPPDGIKINSASKFVIADIPTFTDFATKAYTATSIAWQIYSNATISSFGFSLGSIILEKSLGMGGFGGLTQYTAKSSVVTEGGAINIKTVVDLTNPTNVGMELGIVVFDVSIGGNKVSTISGNVVILPKNTSTITFEGPLQLGQTNPLSLLNKDAPPQITIQGVSVTPPKATGEVVWLNTLIRGFSVTLPFDIQALAGNPVSIPVPAAPAPAPPTSPPPPQK